MRGCICVIFSGFECPVFGRFQSGTVLIKFVFIWFIASEKAVLVDVSEFLQGFFESIRGLRLMTKDLTVVAINLIQLRG